MKIPRVRVKPHSRLSALEEQAGDSWVARINAPPVYGKANREPVTLIARNFDVVKSRGSIRSGAFGRLKRVVIGDRKGQTMKFFQHVESMKQPRVRQPVNRRP